MTPKDFTDRTVDPPPATQPHVGPALHPRLEALLRRVQAAEQTAVGEQRRPTFRLTREILTACVQHGVPITLLAQCLGLSPGSVRSRAHDPDGTMRAALVEELTGLPPAELDRLSDGELTGHGHFAVHPTVYPTNNVIRALLTIPRHEA